MSAASIPLPLARAARFYESTFGKKAIVSVTGIIGFAGRSGGEAGLTRHTVTSHEKSLQGVG